MINCLIVWAWWFLWAILRYLIGLIKVDSVWSFPINTLVINVVWSFLIWVIVALSLKNSSLSPQMILLIKVWFCWWFTTFSTFAYESLWLLESWKVLMALTYIILSVILSILAVFWAEILINWQYNYFQ